MTDQHQATIWANAGMMLIGFLETTFIVKLELKQQFSYKEIDLKTFSGCHLVSACMY